MPTILIVDDDQTVRTVTSRALVRRGCSVLDAATGSEAEAIAMAVSVDMILLDVVMPNQDGYATCTRIRERGYAGPILLISALNLPSRKEKAIQHGANGFVAKPISMDALWKLISEAITVSA